MILPPNPIQKTHSQKARPDHPTWLPYVQESNRGDYLVVGAINGDAGGNFIAICKLRSKTPPLVLVQMGTAHYSSVDNVGSRFYFTTDAGAARGKLVAFDLRSPQRSRDVIAQTSRTLQDVNPAGGRFLVRYLHDVRSDVGVFTYDGRQIGTLPLPGPASVTEVVTDAARPVAYYRYSSPTTPPTIAAYDTATSAASTVSSVRAPFDSTAFVTEEFFARSADGTRVPVFVAHRRDRRVGPLPAPTLLTGYDGFGDSYLPSWSTLGAAWLSRGGAFAIACIRGGGEYGEAWHRAGMLGNKQHVFDDFAAAARLLVARGFATPASLGIYGYSGGGLLTGVSEVQHPELYGAAVEAAGPVDVLRGYKYGIESAWVGEVGSPVASRDQFRWLYAYAPLVHILPGHRYPPTLVMTSTDDDRVSPAHAYKFAATMQWAQGRDARTWLYVARSTGHIGGGSLTQQAAPLADAETFLLARLH